MADHPAARLKSAALTLQAFLLLLAIKVGLTVMPYRKLARILPQPGVRAADGWVKTRTARSMAKAARWLPSATCLPQALAGSVMLGLQGYHSRVQIGVAPVSGKPFRAHAWLICGQDVIIGDGENLDQFVTMTDLRGGRD